MNGAVTVSTTSWRCNLVSSAANTRNENRLSASARLTSAAFCGIRFLISMTAGLPGSFDSWPAEPGVPDSTSTAASAAR